jgi:hypothetical protein
VLAVGMGGEAELEDGGVGRVVVVVVVLRCVVWSEGGAEGTV